MPRVTVPGEPIPAAALAADRAAWVRAVGITLPTIRVADALPGDVVDVDDAVAAELAARGWALEAAPELATLTVAELRALAADLGVELPDRAPKAELVAALAHATPATPEEQ
jgi:hypothetical protein